jgi:transcriptional regulator with XRE-family HTH domain
MSEKKIQKSFIDYGFGFPIRLINVPMIRVRGKWTLNINYNRLTTAVLRFLCDKPVRLTGNEVRFIRQHFEMTLQEFAMRFAVSHAAVIKWEKSRDEPPGMNWASEKDLRLFVLSKISGNSKDFAHLYQELERSKAERRQTIELDAEEIAA